MHSRAAELIRNLGLAAHPEGGAYREVFRATRRVTSAEGRSCAAVTTIYFLLLETQYSRWHRVAQDEVWHFYEGDPLELLWFEPAFERLEHCVLAEVGGDARPVAVVPAGCWQAARCLGGYSFAGCTMGPGFEFEEFELLSDVPEQAERMIARFPEAGRLLEPPPAGGSRTAD